MCRLIWKRLKQGNHLEPARGPPCVESPAPLPQRTPRLLSVCRCALISSQTNKNKQRLTISTRIRLHIPECLICAFFFLQLPQGEKCYCEHTMIYCHPVAEEMQCRLVGPDYFLHFLYLWALVSAGVPVFAAPTETRQTPQSWSQ